MSMNLYCNKIELIQIPTFYSHLIYSNEDGGNNGILYRYEMYINILRRNEINNFRNGIMSQAELDCIINKYKKYYQEIEILRKDESVQFYVL